MFVHVFVTQITLHGVSAGTRDAQVLFPPHSALPLATGTAVRTPHDLSAISDQETSPPCVPHPPPPTCTLTPASPRLRKSHASESPTVQEDPHAPRAPPARSFSHLPTTTLTI